MADASELTRLTARAAVDLLKTGEITPLDLIDAAVARIEAVDGAVNALPIRCYDRARDHARRLMAGEGRGEAEHPAWLAGLPIAIKDLMDVSGVRNTYGCPVFADNVSKRSDVLVERLEGRGGVVLAKSSTPEFGSLPVTWNPIHGHTRSPWDTRLSAGGSSGGAAAALAAGEVWLAQGSDIGGSLRIPAAFCGVVGLRPSAGRVPRMLGGRAFNPLAVQGPMARNVADCALFLDAMAGYWAGDPLTLPAPEVPYARLAAAPRAPKRVGFSPDLGCARVEPEVREICAAAAARFADAGAVVEEAGPDLSGFERAYQVFFQMSLLPDREVLVREHRDAIFPGIVAAIEAAKRLTGDDIAQAERDRAALFGRVAAFFERYDILVCPTVTTPPFPAEQRGPDDRERVSLEYDFDWIAPCTATVLTSCPLIALPAGFTRDGRPVGLQIMGRPRDEAGIIQAAAVLEPMLGVADRLPIDPRTNRAA